MKILVLIRHAKSSWDDPGQGDFDRPLNKRGKQDAPFMGERLKNRGILPDLIVSSPARRAKSTAERIARAVEYPKKAITLKSNLYLADPHEFFEVVRATDDAVQKLFLVGHNPGITEFANTIADYFVPNIPTTGVYAVKFEVNSWMDIEKGTLLFYEYPKKFK